MIDSYINSLKIGGRGQSITFVTIKIFGGQSITFLTIYLKGQIVRLARILFIFFLIIFFFENFKSFWI